MAAHKAEIAWSLREGDDFRGGRYSRGHTISFDGGVTLPASASPHVVGKAWSVEAAADPEEMLVAALSSCHMLVFLHLARQAGFAVAAYRDQAEGRMAAIAPGGKGEPKQALTEVVLHPSIDWDGPAPGQAALDDLHHRAHEGCFIANSVTTKVRVAPPS